MTDSAKLRSWVSAKGMKLSAIAMAIGITPYSLQKKIDGLTEFKASEIAAFMALGMTPEDRDAIFFKGV